MSSKQTYVYDWSYEIKNDESVIRMFTLDTEDCSTCLNVYGFQPFMYVELPSEIIVHDLDAQGYLYAETVVCDWTPIKVDLVYQHLLNRVFKEKVPTKYELKFRKKLYFAHKDEHMKDKYFPFLLLYFNTNEHFHTISYMLTKQHTIEGIGSIMLKTYEHNTLPTLQFVCQEDLPMSGWVEFDTLQPSNKTTRCAYEYDVNIGDVYVPTAIPEHTPNPTVLSFDIEVYSSIPDKFPSAHTAEDSVFQISCVVWKVGQPCTNHILTLGRVHRDKLYDAEITNVQVLEYDTEKSLLDGFCTFLIQTHPQIITGWNIFGFDIDYLIGRMKFYRLKDAFSKCGFIKDKQCAEIDDKWASSAYGNQTFKYFNWNGILIFDLLVFARREIKAENYKLETIASQYVNSHKDPITVKDIYNGYKFGVLNPTPDGKELLSEVAKYCIKDSLLVKLLFTEFDIWIGTTEMASICNVPPSYIYTKGQQIKVFSQVYKFCYDHKIVTEKNAYKCSSNEKYQGAYVRDPTPGVYEYVVPYDFSSLYPSIIIAYNIDYSTFVSDDRIPDSACNVIEWTEDHEYDIVPCIKCLTLNKGERSESHLKWLDVSYQYPAVTCVGCGHIFKFNFAELRTKQNVSVNEKELVINNQCQIKYREKTDKFRLPTNIMTDSYKYRFLKEPKGVLPSIAEHLLDARKKTKKQMKDLKGKCSKNFLNILNKRQLSYKVSCNSLYGSLGFQKGILPLLPGAMCVTAIGRSSVRLAAEHLQDKYKATIVYGDTDSVYVQFKHVSKENIWSHARQVAQNIKTDQVFPSPMSLEFEESIYDPFFILTKKRYMWKYYSEDGTYDSKIGNKGVVLAVRGTSTLLKNIYEKVVDAVFEKTPSMTVLEGIVQYFNLCMTGQLDYEHFIISKQIGLIEGYDQTRSLPAHVKVALLMTQRGIRVDPGQRIEYVITMKAGLNDNVADKSEDVEYQKKHASIIPIDYLYYIHLCTGQIDELLSVAYNIPNFVSQQYTLRVKKHELLTELKNIFKPKLVFA